MEQNYWIGIGGGAFIAIYYDGAFNQVFAPTPPLMPGEWYHLAYSYSTVSGRLSMYLDGELVHTQASGGALTTSSEPILLGNSWSGGIVDGLIDDIYLFDGELEANDIKLLYAEGIPADLSGGGSGAVLPPGSCTTGVIADDFQSQDFSGSTGDSAWLSDWVEVGESDGPFSGDIRNRGFSGNRVMRIRDNQNGGEGIFRRFDLTNFQTATLTIDYARLDLYDPHYLSIRVVDGSGSEVEVGRITEVDGVIYDDPGDLQSATYDLNEFVGIQNQLTIVTSVNMPNSSGAYVDNIRIEGCTK